MFDVEQAAVFARNDTHRVWLRRKLRDGVFKPIVFILHNPSIAGKEKNDPTATRGIGFATALDGSDMIYVNVSTQIATDAMHLDPSHLNCDLSNRALELAAAMTHDNDGVIIAAWGLPKGTAETRRLLDQRMVYIKNTFRGRLTTLRITKSGYPEHPLYLPASLRPTDWE